MLLSALTKQWAGKKLEQKKKCTNYKYKDKNMIKGNGFLQMFSIPPVSGGGAGAHLDFHLDTHHLVKDTDYGKQEAAKEESKHNDSGKSVSTDKDGRTHYYDHGNELASNDRSSDDRSGYGSSSCPYDSYDIDERT